MTTHARGCVRQVRASTRLQSICRNLLQDPKLSADEGGNLSRVAAVPVPAAAAGRLSVAPGLLVHLRTLALLVLLVLCHPGAGICGKLGLGRSDQRVCASRAHNHSGKLPAEAADLGRQGGDCPPTIRPDPVKHSSAVCTCLHLAAGPHNLTSA